MASTKTLILFVALICLVNTVSASVMLEKWVALFNDLNFNNFKKVAMWQLWSTLGPLLAGILRAAAYEQFLDLDEDAKYGMCSAGMCNFEDLYAYTMNLVLYTYVFKYTGTSYTDDEFYEFDLDSLGTLD